MAIFKSKKFKLEAKGGNETKEQAEAEAATAEAATQESEPRSLPLFGDGLIPMPPTLEPPKFGDEHFATAIASMIEAKAPRRFAVVAHDKDTHNSAILAWGLDYGNNNIYVDSVRDETRWHLSKPEDVFGYFPEPPEDDCLQILWIDGPGGLADIYARHYRDSM